MRVYWTVGRLGWYYCAACRCPLDACDEGALLFHPYEKKTGFVKTERVNCIHVGLVVEIPNVECKELRREKEIA